MFSKKTDQPDHELFCLVGAGVSDKNPTNPTNPTTNAETEIFDGENFLSVLNSAGIFLQAHGGKIRFDAPAGKFTPELRAAVAEHRDEPSRPAGRTAPTVMTTARPCSPSSTPAAGPRTRQRSRQRRGRRCQRGPRRCPIASWRPRCRAAATAAGPLCPVNLADRRSCVFDVGFLEIERQDHDQR